MVAALAIARYGSFTRASLELNITQSGLSAMIQSLEEQLGARLFIRTTRSVTITSAGRLLLPSLNRIVEEMAQARIRLGQLENAGQRLLTIAATPMIASSLLPDICTALAEHAAPIEVRVRDAVNLGIQQLVSQGEVDAGFGIFRSIMPGLRRQRVMRFHLIAVAKPGTLPIRRTSKEKLGVVAWSQLREVTMLTLSAPDFTQEIAYLHLVEALVTPPDRRNYDSLHTMIAMAASGRGVAVVPSFALVACQRYGAEFARIGSPKATVEWSCVTKAALPVPPALNSFIETAIQVARELCAETL
jgi:DNA-binding transcriptional LysR family regulator